MDPRMIHITQVCDSYAPSYLSVLPHPIKINHLFIHTFLSDQVSFLQFLCDTKIKSKKRQYLRSRFKSISQNSVSTFHHHMNSTMTNASAISSQNQPQSGPSKQTSRSSKSVSPAIVQDQGLNYTQVSSFHNPCDFCEICADTYDRLINKVSLWYSKCTICNHIWI